MREAFIPCHIAFTRPNGVCLRRDLDGSDHRNTLRVFIDIVGKQVTLACAVLPTIHIRIRIPTMHTSVAPGPVVYRLVRRFSTESALERSIQFSDESNDGDLRVIFIRYRYCSQSAICGNGCYRNKYIPEIPRTCPTHHSPGRLAACVYLILVDEIVFAHPLVQITDKQQIAWTFFRRPRDIPHSTEQLIGTNIAHFPNLAYVAPGWHDNDQAPVIRDLRPSGPIRDLVARTSGSMEHKHERCRFCPIDTLANFSNPRTKISSLRRSAPFASPG